MPLILVSVLSIAVQAGLIVHVIKTGRNSLWIWAIALLPPAGPLAYVAVEILPDLLGGRAARRAKSGVQRMIDPDRDLRRASAEVEISGNVDARRRLAEELLERGQCAQAIEVSQGGLKGIFEHDPTLLLGLARAQFANQDFAASRAALERLVQHNSDFKSADAGLLYARSLEAQDALDEAEREYAAVAPGFPAQRRGCATLCCSSAAASWLRRTPYSRICSTAPSWGPRITAGRRRSGSIARGAN